MKTFGGFLLLCGSIMSASGIVYLFHVYEDTRSSLFAKLRGYSFEDLIIGYYLPDDMLSFHWNMVLVLAVGVLLILTGLLFIVVGQARKSSPRHEKSSILPENLIQVQTDSNHFIGEWKLYKVEIYANGKLYESIVLKDQDCKVVQFYPNGYLRYYESYPDHYYEGSYVYNSTTSILMLNKTDENEKIVSECVSVEFSDSEIIWKYKKSAQNEIIIEYYTISN